MNDKKWYQQSDIMLGIAVVATIAMLVIPIPAFMLDFLMSFSIMLGLVTLLTAMYNRQITDFSVFPTLLLISTVFRLALNVSSTRLILMDGPNFKGDLVRAFGEFVVGGNYLIGFIIFLILILVQMMVITKGATRISEVAARFTLDALPGKQMSIDSDLTAGLITEEEARERRETLRKEVDFYGQMDGATKFVQGDVRVGLLITAINIIGGLIIGMSVRGETFDVASRTYSLLTIGDGLVAQIPSLLITTATGMVVTRSGASEDLSSDLSNQLFQNARILYITGGTLLFSTLLPGFPFLPLLALGSLIVFLAYNTARQEVEKVENVAKAEEEQQPASTTERFLDEISVDPLKLEIGYNLVPLVDRSQGGALLEKITSLRQKFAREMGMVVPPIRITDDMHNLEANEYSIQVSGIEVGRSRVYPDQLAALNSGNVANPLEGQAFTDPTYKLSGVLIDQDQKADAEEAGYLVVDATNVVITHLSEILRQYATQIMGREEVKLLLERLKEKFPTVVEESQKAGNQVIQGVMHNLLKENISIRNMPAILETIADHQERTKDPISLTDLVRQRLGRQIVSQFWEDNNLQIVQVDPALENELRAAVTYDDQEGRVFALEPAAQIRIRDAFIRAYNETQNQGYFPIFLTSGEVRAGVFMLLERELNSRQFAVLAYEELPTEVKLEMIGQVVIEEQSEDAVR